MLLLLLLMLIYTITDDESSTEDQQLSLTTDSACWSQGEENATWTSDCLALNGSPLPSSTVTTDQKWDSAYFLLKATEEHFLTHDGVETLCDNIQLFVEQVCSKVATSMRDKLANAGVEVSLPIQEEIAKACCPDDLFTGLRSRYLREKYYEEVFNYVVSYYCCSTLV